MSNECSIRICCSEHKITFSFCQGPLQHTTKWLSILLATLSTTMEKCKSQTVAEINTIQSKYEIHAMKYLKKKTVAKRIYFKQPNGAAVRLLRSKECVYAGALVLCKKMESQANISTVFLRLHCRLTKLNSCIGSVHEIFFKINLQLVVHSASRFNSV